MDKTIEMIEAISVLSTRTAKAITKHMPNDWVINQKELAKKSGVSQTNISTCCKQLAAIGVVDFCKSGKYIFYKLNAERINDLHLILDTFLNEPARRCGRKNKTP